MLIGLFISKAFTEAKWFVETRTKANGDRNQSESLFILKAFTEAKWFVETGTKAKEK